jgi:hypothetical protein
VLRALLPNFRAGRLKFFCLCGSVVGQGAMDGVENIPSFLKESKFEGSNSIVRSSFDSLLTVRLGHDITEAAPCIDY